MFDKSEFKRWLKKKRKLGLRSANDVCSRYNRVVEMTKAPENSNPDTLLSKLNKNKEFLGLTVTVRSQLRRSIALAKKFLNA
jgi:hypothetical protein